MKALIFLVCCVTLSVTALAQTVPSDHEIKDFFTYSTPSVVSFILSVTLIKITAFVIGYLIVKLGHDTLIRGVNGDIDFGFEGKGFSTKLKAGSPGAFFVLAGAAIILWGLFVDKPLNIHVKPAAQTQQQVPAAQTDSNKDISGTLKPLPGD